jgi:hypothetical protein
MTIKAIASCHGHHAVRHVNPVTYSTGVDVAVRFTKSKSDGPLLLAGAARSNSKPLPNLNATIDREAWVLDEKNLEIVNFVGNRQYITLENLAEIANAHTAISRGRRCHLSQLNARERWRPPNVELCCQRVARDFFAEAGISKNY